MERSLEGRTALVTGSTSGIGRGIALAFAQAGAKILLHGLGAPGQVDKVRAELAEVTGGEVAYSAADLSDAREVRKMCAQAEEVLGHVDILVNNAGIQFTSPVEQFPEEKWDQIIAINLSSAFHATAALLPGMRKAGWGRIINIASAHGLVGSPNKVAYVAAKHGIVGMTKVVALETARGTGVTCNAICPGFVETPIVAKQIADQARTRHMTEAQVLTDVILAAQPTKRFVTTEELVGVFLYLVSDLGASANGASFSIDGGWTAQ